MSLLEARGLSQSFGVTPALVSAEISVDAGEVVAVMGPSGSGKSTLLHCIAGIVRPEAGTVTYDGRELSAMSDADRSALRRSEFGFVFQFGQLVPELSCRENVALPLRLDGVARREAERRADALLAVLEVSGVTKQRPGTVSGGEGQRVAVARALVTDPRVLFADEPTGALDSLNGERVMELLTAAARERATAVVLVTHEARVAASIPSIHDGRQARGEARSDLGFDQAAAGSAASGEAGAGEGDEGGAGKAGSDASGEARSGTAGSSPGAAGPGGMLVVDAGTRFRGRDVRGRLLQPDGRRAPAAQSSRRRKRSPLRNSVRTSSARRFSPSA